jgi:hypothetical protein
VLKLPRGNQNAISLPTNVSMIPKSWHQRYYTALRALTMKSQHNLERAFSDTQQANALTALSRGELPGTRTCGMEERMPVDPDGHDKGFQWRRISSDRMAA